MRQDSRADERPDQLGLSFDATPQKSEDPKLIIHASTFELVQPTWPRYLNVTDRQTDRRTDGRTDGRLTIAISR